MPIMDKQTKLLDASLTAFVRYGIRRTTMGDIAEIAGVSRQTLYTSYPNKDDLMAATVAWLTGKIIADIRADWAKSADLGTKIDAYFNRAVIPFFEMMRTAPDSADLINGANEAAKIAVTKADARKGDLLVELFTPFAGQITASGQSVAQFARFVQSSSSNLKLGAEDIEDLKSMLSSLKISVLAVAI